MKRDIPKKYNKKEVEDKIRRFWEDEDVFKFNYDSEKPVYSIDTPPPYVSADHLHSGHLMSYAQAEFVARYKRMKGFNVFYPMGFDDNGLPTERYVEQKHGVDKSSISRQEFIELCLEETEKGAQNYKKLWRALGISVDWTKTYSTISPLARKVSQKSLLDLWVKGYLERKKNPILWCTHCDTAVSQADMEDKEVTTKLNYINFKSQDGDDLLIATTRPEFIPACVALYVNPNDTRYSNLAGTKAVVPISGHEVEIKASEEVDIEFGTGLMMVCTWGDQEDVAKWIVDQLDTREILGKNGTLNELAGKYQGLGIKEARKAIIEDLNQQGLIQKQEDLVHTVNIHERCDTPVEFVNTKQWFIKLVEYKDQWIEQGKKINWYPDFKYNDYELWVNSLKWDWCISRQRYYGVPFPIWYCASCGEPHFVSEELLPHDPMVDACPFDKCEKCEGSEFVPEKDVMDTWATSSCTPFLIKELVNDPEVQDKIYPNSLRPNAFEIIRTWDFYSIVKSFFNFDTIPFENVMISGHGLDAEGKKISKRLGNYTPANELIDFHGADPIRYWATGAHLGSNLRFSEEEIKKGEKTTIKLWNAMRFLSMYLKDFDPLDEIETQALEDSDKWIISEHNKAVEEISMFFDNYEYAKARDTAESFFWYTFADYYIEFTKHRLRDDFEDEKSKKAAQTVLYKVFLSCLKFYAPILPFITEEIYQLFYAEDQESIHLSSWPEKIEMNDFDKEDFDKVVQAVDEIRKLKSQGIKENITLETEVDLDKYKNFLESVCRVSFSK